MAAAVEITKGISGTRSDDGRSRDARRTLDVCARKMRFQALSQEEPRAMHPLSDVDDAETKGLSDFLVRKPVYVAQ